MTFDKRFYGVYLGICVDNADPEENNRIQLQVPQVLGEAVTEWALPCLPITSNSNHPDHKEHLASEVAALLTTTPVTVTSGTGPSYPSGTHTHSVTVPALTVVAKVGAGTLTHPHEVDPDEIEKWNDNLETNTTAEHTPHRMVPALNQKVWVMFIAGDPNFPVWMGVLL